MTHSSFLQDELKIVEQIDGDQVILKLNGALSVTTVPYFRQAVQPFIDRKLTAIVLDFEGVTKIVSRGVPKDFLVNRKTSEDIFRGGELLQHLPFADLLL